MAMNVFGRTTRNRLLPIICTVFAAVSAPWCMAAEESLAPAERAELVLDLQGYSGLVTGLALSPDGSLLAAAGGKEVRVWRVGTGELVATLRGQRERDSYGNCYTLAFSPDGRHLAVGIDDYTNDGSIRVYATDQFQEIEEVLAGHSAPAKRLAFSRDGRYLASAGENGKILLWDWPSRRIAATVPPRDPNQPIYFFFEFPTEEPLLMANDVSGLAVISALQGQRLPPGSPIPDALRNWISLGPRMEFPFQGKPAAFSLRLERSAWLAGGSGQEGGQPRYWVAFWNSLQPRPSQVYRGHQYVITAVALDPSCQLAASADVLGNVHLWDTSTGQARQVFRSVGQPMYRASLDVAGKRVGFSSRPHPAGQWNRNNFGTIEQVFDLGGRRVSPDMSGDFPRESPIVGDLQLKPGAAGDLFLLDCLRGGVKIESYKIRAGASPMCFGFVRRPQLGPAAMVVVGDDNGVLFAYDPTNNEERRDFVGHTSFVTSLSESVDGRFLTTSSTDRTIRIWSLTDYRPTGDVDFRYLSDTVIEVKPGTSSAAAGIQLGDRFVSMDGKNLTELGNERINGTYKYLPGQQVPVVMERNGQPYQTQLTLKEGSDLVEPLLSLLVAGERDWVIWTPQGYYDASPGADRLIGWHVNQGPKRSAKFYPAHQFRKQLYRPDIIDLVLETGSVEEAVRRAQGDTATPVTLVDFRQTETLRQMEPPRVRIIAPAEGSRTAATEINVLAEIQTQNDLPVKEVTLLVNGRPLGEKGLAVEAATDKPRTSFSRSVPLVPGANQISVIAANPASTSQAVTVNVICDAVQTEIQKPKLYLLAVGVSKYSKEQFNLRFADRDAEAFTAAWQAQEGLVYDEVATKLVVNEEASSRSILSAMDWLVKSVTQRDVAVMFVSAHGIRDSRQNYYLATHEVDPDSLRSTAVRFSEIKEVLRDLPCKVMLFVDTCHSGGVTGAKSLAWEDPLHDLVSEECGAVVFSSSLPREVSLEDPSWGHGAFTKALLDAFGSPESDTNGDGYLSISELEAQVYDRVKQLTKGNQHPVVERPPTIRNFSFYFVGRK